MMFQTKKDYDGAICSRYYKLLLENDKPCHNKFYDFEIAVYNFREIYEKIDYVDIIRTIKRTTAAGALILRIPYSVFYFLLWLWSQFDRNPPFTTQQLAALIARDEFEVIDWPTIFDVACTPFATAIDETFNHPVYGRVVLEF